MFLFSLFLFLLPVLGGSFPKHQNLLVLSVQPSPVSQCLSTEPGKGWALGHLFWNESISSDWISVNDRQ